LHIVVSLPFYWKKQSKTTKLLEHKIYQAVETQKLPSCWNIKTTKLLEHKNYQAVRTLVVFMFQQLGSFYVPTAW
jgi:hypothetical protein